MNYLLVLYYISVLAFSYFVSKYLVSLIRNNIAKLVLTLIITVGYFALILNSSEVDYYTIDVFSLKTLDIFYRGFYFYFLGFISLRHSESLDRQKI